MRILNRRSLAAVIVLAGVSFAHTASAATASPAAHSWMSWFFAMIIHPGDGD